MWFVPLAQETQLQNSGEDAQSSLPDSLQTYDVHPQDSPEDRGFLILSKDRKSSLRIRGSIRFNGGFDLNGLQSKNTFSTYDIPMGDENVDEVRYFMSINQTRLGIEASRESSVGEIFMRVETDFMGPNGVPRLRHVYGATGGWLVGQTWSVFGDVTSLPNTVDLDGPNSSTAERTVQIRYSGKYKNGIRWAVSAESPRPDIRYPDTLNLQPSFQSFPDIASRFRKDFESGHVQLAAILRSISGKDTINEPYYLAGYGGLVSGKLAVDDRASILFQGFYGSAISRFITGLTDKGLDAVYNPETVKFEPLSSLGGFASFGFEWKPRLYSYFTAGTIKILNKSYQPESDMSFSYYFSGNFFWDTIAGTRAGVEYSWGRRTNIDKNHGEANRISFIFFYDF